jgi:hypothetical protein
MSQTTDKRVGWLADLKVGDVVTLGCWFGFPPVRATVARITPTGRICVTAPMPGRGAGFRYMLRLNERGRVPGSPGYYSGIRPIKEAPLTITTDHTLTPEAALERVRAVLSETTP